MLQYLSTIAAGLLFALFCIAGNVQGEYYKYKDSDGVVHFTDNLDDVPREQREDIQMFEGVKKTVADPLSREKVSEETEKRVSGEGQDSLNDEINRLNTRIRALTAWKVKLDNTYNDLAKRQTALAGERKKARTKEEIQAVNQKATALNTEIDAYEKDRMAYEKERSAVAKKAASN